MTVVAQHNDELELNRVDYAGSVTMAELAALAGFNADNPSWVTYDTVSVVHPGADFLNVDFAELDALFRRYKDIYEPLNLLIMRRSAWICQSAAALKHVRHWTGDPEGKRKRLATDIRVLNSYDEVAEWLLLRPAELQKLKTGEGFAEIFRTDARVVGALR